jgi:hypothetical protein
MFFIVSNRRLRPVTRCFDVCRKTRGRFYVTVFIEKTEADDRILIDDLIQKIDRFSVGCSALFQTLEVGIGFEDMQMVSSFFSVGVLFHSGAVVEHALSRL